MGDIECQFLHQINAISVIVNFFMGHKQQENYVCCFRHLIPESLLLHFPRNCLLGRTTVVLWSYSLIW